ncbi:glycosyltransferase [Halomonas sp. DN3]|uniref:glycosyltransferase n=1 Tax=Halomonas sp. DN3 TaxID=2953657 RepID=UPI0020A0273E|nr:glycosyltransferase [Halomonas sp. DN3]USZ51580.1 glycosyltransferase [Halomonas sp. DN3]
MLKGSALSILFVVDHLESGGAPVVVKDLIDGMVAAGADVSLLILSERQAHPLPDEVEVSTLPYRGQGRIGKWLRYRRHARLLDGWLAANGTHYDLVYAHLHHAHQVVSRSRLKDAAWYCLHSDPVIGFLGNKRGLARLLKKHKVRSLYHGRKLVTVSQAMLDRLIRHFNITPSRGEAIHNPIAIENVRDLASTTVTDVPEDYLVYVGRTDNRQKRLDRLLDAYQASRVALPLVVVGGGSGLADVEEMVRERRMEDQVVLVGYRGNPYPYMKQARALLLSSDYEGFPLVLLEALACQTPVISVDCPTGPSELLTGDLSPWLVPLGNIEAFGVAIARAVEKTPVVSEQQCEPFRLDNVVKRYLALHGGGRESEPGSESVTADERRAAI